MAVELILQKVQQNCFLGKQHEDKLPFANNFKYFILSCFYCYISSKSITRTHYDFVKVVDFSDVTGRQKTLDLIIISLPRQLDVMISFDAIKLQFIKA
jgi:hypothetical protein